MASILSGFVSIEGELFKHPWLKRKTNSFKDGSLLLTFIQMGILGCIYFFFEKVLRVSSRLRGLYAKSKGRSYHVILVLKQAAYDHR